MTMTQIARRIAAAIRCSVLEDRSVQIADIDRATALDAVYEVAHEVQDHVDNPTTGGVDVWGTDDDGNSWRLWLTGR